MELLTAIGTVLGIAFVQILRDWRDGKNVFTKNAPIEQGFSYMKSHYNDELTAVLTEIQINSAKIAISMDKIDDKIDEMRVNGVRTKI